MCVNYAYLVSIFFANVDKMMNGVKCEKSQYIKVNSVYNLKKYDGKSVLIGTKKYLEISKKICTNLHKKTKGIEALTEHVSL